MSEVSLDEADERTPKLWIFQAFAGGAAGAALVALVVAGIRVVWPRQLTNDHMTYPELISVILTGIAVLITILGVFVAALAVWGYNSFRQIAKRAAKTHVKEDIKSGKLRIVVEKSTEQFLIKEFGDDGKLRSMLETRLDAVMLKSAEARSKIKPIENPIELSQDPNSSEDDD